MQTLKGLVQRENPPALPVVMYRRLCRTLKHGKVPEALTCGVPVQLPHRMGAEVSLPGADGGSAGERGERHPHPVRVAGSRSDGTQRASGSCASGVFDTTKAVGVGVHGVFGRGSWLSSCSRAIRDYARSPIGGITSGHVGTL